MTSEAGPALSEFNVSLFTDEVKDYLLTHGALLKLVRTDGRTTVTARPIGVSLIPTSFPPHLFQEAIELQPAFHQLYANIVVEWYWLFTVLEPLLKQDEFLAALWQIHQEVVKAGPRQQICCGIFRSDYMLHQDGSQTCLKQVEMNTTCIAGACHAESTVDMHHHLDRIRNIKDPEHSSTESLPRNNNISGIVSTLRNAHLLYKPAVPGQTCILMVVQPKNFNVADERPIEYGLWDEQIPCFRCDWQSVQEQTFCANKDVLLYCPPSSAETFEVSVIYYRAGYEPSEYDSDGIDTRLYLEMTRAIKCPDILTHLTTFKSVQQALTRPGAVERFISSPETQTQIRSTFMQIHNLDSPQAQEIATDPEHAAGYVLKPNLEGGGHNIYRSLIPAFLAAIGKDRWPNYVLMRAIRPPSDIRGILMMPERIYHGAVTSELGVLGGCIWRRDDSGEACFLHNEVLGWTFKTKPKHVDEMSVVKGFGCFDCPVLVS